MAHDERSEVTAYNQPGPLGTYGLREAIEHFKNRPPIKTLSHEEIRAAYQDYLADQFLKASITSPGPLTTSTDTRRPTPRNRKERRAAKHRRQP